MVSRFPAHIRGFQGSSLPDSAMEENMVADTVFIGLIQARPPSPPPPPRKVEKREIRETRETDIDIYHRGEDTEIDITNTRSRSRPRPRPRSASRERPPPRNRQYYHEEEVTINSSRDKLKIDIDHEHRSSSARPSSHSVAPESDDEAERITGRIGSRGGMGEAWGGRTKDWTVVDVPPGTEKVRMDGAGGGAAEVVWERYSGARKAKFIAERTSEGTIVPASPPASSSVTAVSAGRDYARPRTEHDHLSVEIYNKSRDRSRDRDVEIEKVTDRRISIRPSQPPAPPAPLPRPKDMWTEVTKDLVIREAIEDCGYEYEETELFFYVMQYLKYVSLPIYVSSACIVIVITDSDCSLGGCSGAGRNLGPHPRAQKGAHPRDPA